MIAIIDKEKCCGCSACAQKCPKHCIDMREDEEGFLYPHVDTKKCINCNICENVCPVINQNTEKSPISCYAAKNPNEEIRIDSSSGGVFSMLAEQILNQGGVVFGAKFNESCIVEHAYCENREELGLYRGSKYVQSNIGNSYIDVKRFLEQGRYVLFSGTPCQVAGLRRFLGKNFNNLLTVDFICHGVPSIKVFHRYLKEDLKITNIKSVKSVKFRNKQYGWKSFSLVITVKEKDTDKECIAESSMFRRNSFMKGFLANLYLRPSCYNCPVKSGKSGSDITLADFWGISKVFPDFDDDRGVSALIINTEIGEKIIPNSFIFREVNLNEIISYNSSYYRSVTKTVKRDQFFSLREVPFKQVIDDLTYVSLYKRIVSVLFCFLYEIKTYIRK